MTDKHWKEIYEEHSSSEKKSMDMLSVTDLLQKIQRGEYGEYYQIWYSIGERASLKEAGTILYQSLVTMDDYLQRYHCATALLTLLGSKQFESVQLSSDMHGRKSNLELLQALLQRKLY